MNSSLYTLGYRSKNQEEKTGKPPDDDVLVPSSPGSAEALEQVIRFLLEKDKAKEEVTDSSRGEHESSAVPR